MMPADSSTPTPTVDIAYLAHRRPEFTSVSLLNLLKNTPWHRVNALHIFTDGDEESANVVRGLDLKPITRRIGGPVAILNTAMEISTADYVCKIDNDTMVPPGWLDYCLGTAEFKSIDLLGIEAWALDPDVFPEPITELVHPYGVTKGLHGVRSSHHVGGIGLFRRSAFSHSQPRPARDGRYGFTEWQWENSHITKAFLNPPLPVFLLDHLPMEPWVALSRRYVESGAQRETWGVYPSECATLWQWWAGAHMRHTHAHSSKV
jgi:hypothetical protein